MQDDAARAAEEWAAEKKDIQNRSRAAKESVKRLKMELSEDGNQEDAALLEQLNQAEEEIKMLSEAARFGRESSLE